MDSEDIPPPPAAPKKVWWRRVGEWLAGAGLVLFLAVNWLTPQGWGCEPVVNTGTTTYYCQSGCDEADAERASELVLSMCLSGDYDAVKITLVHPGGEDTETFDCNE